MVFLPLNKSSKYNTALRGCFYLIMRNLLAILGISVALSFSTAWVAQTWRYEAKLKDQELSFIKQQEIIQKVHLDTLNELNLNTSNKVSNYTNQLKEINVKYQELMRTNSSMRDDINRLRNNEKQLYSRISTLPNETIRNYALSASTAVTELSGALGEEQLAHQETFRELESCIAALNLFDKSWPTPNGNKNGN